MGFSSSVIFPLYIVLRRRQISRFVRIFSANSTNHLSTLKMGTGTLIALSVASAVALYARSLGSSYSMVFLGLWASSIAQLTLYLAYHSLVYRWFLSSTKALPYPKVCAMFLPMH